MGSLAAAGIEQYRDLGEVVVWTAALFGALGVLARSRLGKVFMRFVFRPIGSAVGEAVADGLEPLVTRVVKAELVTIEARTLQLVTNGGSSMHDAIRRVEQTTHEKSALAQQNAEEIAEIRQQLADLGVSMQSIADLKDFMHDQGRHP